MRDDESKNINFMRIKGEIAPLQKQCLIPLMKGRILTIMNIRNKVGQDKTVLRNSNEK